MATSSDPPDLAKLTLSLLNIISGCNKANLAIPVKGWLTGVAYMLGGHKAANELAEGMIESGLIKIDAGLVVITPLGETFRTTTDILERLKGDDE